MVSSGLHGYLRGKETYEQALIKIIIWKSKNHKELLESIVDNALFNPVCPIVKIKGEFDE